MSIGIEGELGISKDLVSTMSTAEAQPLSNITSSADGDNVIWRVVSSNSCDNLAMPNSATFATIDDSVVLSSGSSAIYTNNTQGSLLQPPVSVSSNTVESSATNTSIQHHGSACPSELGCGSACTPYRFV